MFKWLLRPICWWRAIHRSVIQGYSMDGHSYEFYQRDGDREDLRCKTCGKISSAYYNKDTVYYYAEEE